MLVLAVAPGCLVTVDNDIFGSDRNYTAGFRGLHTFRRPEPGSPEETQLNGLQSAALAVSELVDVVDLAIPAHCDEHTEAGLVFGHAIFTPENLEATRLIRDDRPYAGWLYAGFVHAESALDRDPTRRRDSQLWVEFDVGVVGPAAQAEELQTAVHRLINDELPQGWDNQLHNEPALLLRVARQTRNAYWGDGAGWAGDALTGWQLNLGNVAVTAGYGGTLRWGWELPRTFAVGIGERATGHGTNGHPIDSIYAFAGVDGKLVLRDIFLDGNSFRDSHSVSKRPVVGAVRAGLACHLGDWIFAFAHERRTREFEEQDGSGHAFSSLSVGYRLGR